MPDAWPDTSVAWYLACAQVMAYLDGQAIPSTPFAVRCTPAPLHAPACRLRGLDAASDSVRAGALELEVHGRDAFGNSTPLLPRHEGLLMSVLELSGQCPLHADLLACVAAVLQGCAHHMHASGF